MQQDTLYVVKPGSYKRVKQYKAGRECECGTRLSIYNPSQTCYTCKRDG